MYSRVIEQPAFVTRGVSYEDIFFNMWLKKVVLILLNVNIGCAFPNSEVEDICIEGLKWSSVGKRSCRKAIPDMNYRRNAVAPE